MKVFDHFSGCDEIWHAGDIGTAAVADKLRELKPLRAVHGNIDGRDLQARFPQDLRFSCEDLKVWITHIAGIPPAYNTRIKKHLAADPPDILVCGHSHILSIRRDTVFGNLLFLNPGAAGNQGFHYMKTLIRLEITGKEVKNLEVIEIGKRGLSESVA